MDISLNEWVRTVQNLPYFERRMEIATRVRPQLRRFLYKYKFVEPNNSDSIERARDILVKSKLWLSSPVDFNDPFDMSAKIIAQSTGLERRERMDKSLKEQGVRWKERKKRIREHAKISIDQFEKDLAKVYRKNLEELGVFFFCRGS